MPACTVVSIQVVSLGNCTGLKVLTKNRIQKAFMNGIINILSNTEAV
jgi:hypothetical protein